MDSKKGLTGLDGMHHTLHMRSPSWSREWVTGLDAQQRGCMYVEGGRLTLKMPKNANPALRSTLRVPQPAFRGVLWPSIGRDESLIAKHCTFTRKGNHCPQILAGYFWSNHSARGDTCDGTVEGDVDRPAHAINLKPA